MPRKLSLLLLLIFTTLVACSPKKQQDCGYVQNSYGERISWKGVIPVTVYLHESVPDAYVPAIESAAKSWMDASGKPLFNIITDQRVKGGLTPEQDGQNIIYYFNTWESDKASEQARTSVYWVGDQIKEADMRINGLNFTYYWYPPASSIAPPPDAVNIEALVIHELGHMLGLKHKDKDGSVMATYLAADTDRTLIAPTDKSSLECEY